MKLLLRAFDHLCEEVNHAVVDIDIDELLELRELLQMARSKNGSVDEIVAGFGELWFYSDQLDGEVEEDLYDKEWLPVTDELELGEGEVHNVDDEEVVVGTHHVYWRAHQPHGPGDFSTTGLSWEQLIKLKEKADGPVHR